MTSPTEAIRQRHAGVTIQAITTMPDLEALESGWRRVHAESRSAANLFASWEWMSLWARHYLTEGQLWLLAARGGSGELLGLLPLYRRWIRLAGVPAREARFLATEEVCSSYLDLLSAPRHHRAVVEALYAYLHGPARGAWDLLTLAQTPADSPTVDLWTSLAEESGKVTECAGLTVCPVIDLAGGREGLLRGMSANERYNLRRKQRRLAEAGVVALERVGAAPGLAKALETLAALHGLRWGERGGGAFHRPRFAAFHREFVERVGARGWVRVDLLKLGGEAIAAVYGFQYADRYSYYLPGLDATALPAASPGALLLWHCVEHALVEGCREVDLLQGWAGYKLAWATGLRRSLTLRHYNRHARSALAKLLLGARDAAKILLR